jgi:hypothetical protein
MAVNGYYLTRTDRGFAQIEGFLDTLDSSAIPTPSSQTDYFKMSATVGGVAISPWTVVGSPDWGGTASGSTIDVGSARLIMTWSELRAERAHALNTLHLRPPAELVYCGWITKTRP